MVFMHEEKDLINNARGNPLSSYHLDERYRASLSLVPPKSSVIVDMGSGEGYFSKELLHRFPSAKVIGVDLSKLSFCKNPFDVNLDHLEIFTSKLGESFFDPIYHITMRFAPNCLRFED